MAKFNLPDPYIAELIRWAESIGATPSVPRVTKRYKKTRRPCGTARKRRGPKPQHVQRARAALISRGLEWAL